MGVLNAFDDAIPEVSSESATSQTDRKRSDIDQTPITKRPHIAVRPCCIWCPDAESNHGHADFQSAALPTELSGRRMVPATGIELVTY